MSLRSIFKTLLAIVCLQVCVNGQELVEIDLPDNLPAGTVVWTFSDYPSDLGTLDGAIFKEIDYCSIYDYYIKLNVSETNEIELITEKTLEDYFNGDCFLNNNPPLNCLLNISLEASGVEVWESPTYMFRFNVIDTNNHPPEFSDSSDIVQLFSNHTLDELVYSTSISDYDLNPTETKVTISRPEFFYSTITDPHCVFKFHARDLDIRLRKNLPNVEDQIVLNITANDGVFEATLELTIEIIPAYEDVSSTTTEGVSSTTIELTDKTVSSENVSSTTTQPTTTEAVSRTTINVPSTPNPINSISCESIDPYGLKWVGKAGTLVSKPCSNDANKFATWFCDTNGKFQGLTPNYSGCSTSWIGDLEETVGKNETFTPAQSLDIAKQIDKNIQDAINYGEQIPGEKGNTEYYGHEIQKLIDGFRNLSAKTSFEKSNEAIDFGNSTFAIINSVLLYMKPWEQLNTLEKSSHFTQLLELGERNNGEMVLLLPKDSEPISFNLNTIQSTTGHITNSSVLNFPLDSKKVAGKDSFITVHFTGNSTSYIATTVKSKFIEKYVGSIVNTVEPINKPFAVNGNMLSVTIVSNATGVLRKLRNEDISGVDITFYHTHEVWGSSSKRMNRKLHDGENPRGSRGDMVCAYWDTNLLIWSTSGCTVTETSQFSTSCHCTHLTGFDILTPLHEYRGKSIWTILIPLFGFGLVLIPGVLTYFLTKNKSKSIEKESDIYEKYEGTQKLIHLVLILNYLFIFFLVDRHFVYASEENCRNIGILMHFVLLLTFVFLSIDAYDMLKTMVSDSDEGSSSSSTNQTSPSTSSTSTIKNQTKIELIISKVKNSDGRFLLPAKLFAAFLLSFVIVITTIIWDVIIGINSRAYGGDFCWLDGGYIWSFFVPLLSCILVTIGILLKNHFQLKPTHKNKEMIKAIIQQTTKVYALITLCWIVGFFQIGPYYIDSKFLTIAFYAVGALLTGAVKSRPTNFNDVQNSQSQGEAVFDKIKTKITSCFQSKPKSKRNSTISSTNSKKTVVPTPKDQDAAADCKCSSLAKSITVTQIPLDGYCGHGHKNLESTQSIILIQSTSSSLVYGPPNGRKYGTEILSLENGYDSDKEEVRKRTLTKHESIC